jgi:hypothetical protein
LLDWTRIRKKASQPTQPIGIPEVDVYIGVPEDYPVFPPPSPEEIIKEGDKYWTVVEARKFAAPKGESSDAPLFALYRLYEAFVLDKRFAYRNALENFWRNPSWKLDELPDPKDSDQLRYAFLAGVTYLMARSFNERIKLGLVRGARPLMSMEEAEEAKQVPLEQRPWEKVPNWAEKASSLEDTLAIPTEDGEFLKDKEDERADQDFLQKNILLWTPHISFT